MISDAMGAYPLTRTNKEKLRGCVFKEMSFDNHLQANVFIFNDPYRKLNIDLLFTGNGELYISDFYGESMNRESIFYVRF